MSAKPRSARTARHAVRITRQRVAAAMAASPRRAHLPREQWDYADEDNPLPLFNQQTSSQPSTVATMLHLLNVPEGARVLDVGAGSGWTTAILAHLTGSDGSVLGIELDPELAQWGADNLANIQRPWARIEPARPGVLGAPEHGPYDRILVSAMASVLPRELVAQLVIGGLMVIPVAGEMHRVIRDSEVEFRLRSFGKYRFVPLITD